MSTLKPYIAALAERTGLDLEVSPDDSFVALLGERKLLIQTLAEAQALLFYMDLGQPCSFRHDEILATLLSANLFLEQTRGAALSYDAANDRVGLNRIVPVQQLKIEGFIDVFENFMIAAEAWGNRLDAENAQAEEQARLPLDGAEDDGEAAAPEGPMLRI